MRTSSKPGLAVLFPVIVLIGMLTTHFVVAQPSGGQGAPLSSSPSSDLQSLVQVASSAQAYAQSEVALASSDGLDVSADTTLMASGNGSLAVAQADLSEGGNLTAASVAVHAAMGDFTNAAASASVALQSAGSTSSTDLAIDLGTVAALNGSTMQLSKAVDETCASSSTTAIVAALNSSQKSRFMVYCAAAGSSIDNATADLGAAALLLTATGSGGNGTGIQGFGNAIAQVKTDLSGASTELTALTPFTYAARGTSYIDGPLAAKAASADAAVALQGRLLGWYDSDVSGYQASVTSQASADGSMTASASTVASAISSVPMSSVTSSAAAQQQTLTVILSNLTSLSQQVASLPLSALLLSGLQSDIAASETSFHAYNSALSSLGSSAASFPTVTIGGYPSYVASFDSASSNESADATASSSSLSTLQGQLETLAAEFPLIQSLGIWYTTFSQTGTQVDTGATDVSDALQAASASMLALSADVASLTTQVQGISQAEVSAALLQNVSSIYLSESQFLNSSGLASLSSAVRSLQSAAQLSSGFVASSQALLQTTIGGFTAASQLLGSQSSPLSTQAQSTSSSMADASGYLQADLDARTLAVAMATALTTEAMTAFDDQQVAQGAMLAAQASAQLAVASSVAAG